MLRAMPLKSEFSLSEFDFLTSGLAVEEVISVLGAPNRQIGSGFLRDVYHLDDGRVVVLHYGMYREQLYHAYISDAGGDTIIDWLI